MSTGQDRHQEAVRPLWLDSWLSPLKRSSLSVSCIGSTDKAKMIIIIKNVYTKIERGKRREGLCKELAHIITETGKFQIRRVAHQAEDPGK